MGKFVDLTGQKFGRLTALKTTEKNNQGKYLWLCDCECGNQAVVASYNLKNGHTKSCGCLSKEMLFKSHKKYNTYDLSGNYGIGYTSKNEEFYFDLDDYDKIKEHCWYINSNGYVMSHINKKYIGMHRLIMSPPDGVFIDHIHAERKNDNRKSNLRLADISENGMNKNVQKYNTSGIIGVSYCKTRKMWVASINIRNKQYKKRFKNFEDAVAQRKTWEETYFGEYSYSNSQKQII